MDPTTTNRQDYPTDGTQQRLAQIARATRVVTSKYQPAKSLQTNPVQFAQTTRTTYHQQIEDKVVDDIPYPLTTQEAFWLIENILGITDSQSLLSKEPVAFLNVITERMNIEIPFSNIHIISQPPNNKYCHNFQECKEAIFRRQGGYCFYNNIFFKALLDCMGYKTFHIGGNNPGDYQLDTHVSIIVCDLTYPGSYHLVDPGTIRPLYQAIPLNFQQESPVYQSNYLKSKFFIQENGILLWCAHAKHQKTTSSSNFIQSGKSYWKIEMIYRLNVVRTRDYFLHRYQCRLTLPCTMPRVHQRFVLAAHKDGRILVSGSLRDTIAMRCEHEDPDQVEMIFFTKQDFVNYCTANFPQFPRKMVEDAIDFAPLGSRLYKI